MQAKLHKDWFPVLCVTFWYIMLTQLTTLALGGLHSRPSTLNTCSRCSLTLHCMHSAAICPARSIRQLNSVIWSKQCRARHIPHTRACCRSRQRTYTVCFLPDQQQGSTSHSGVMSKGAAVQEAGTLSVLTLNIWGLWLVSKRRAERVRWVAAALRLFKQLGCLIQPASAAIFLRAGETDAVDGNASIDMTPLCFMFV